MSEQHRPSSYSSSSSSNIQDQYLIITDIYAVQEKVARTPYVLCFISFKQIIVHRKKVRFFFYAVLFALTVMSVSFPLPTLEDSNPRRD